MVLSVQIPKVGSAGEFIFKDLYNAPPSTSVDEDSQTRDMLRNSKPDQDEKTPAQLESCAEDCEDAGLWVPRVGSTGEFRFAV